MIMSVASKEPTHTIVDENNGTQHTYTLQNDAIVLLNSGGAIGAWGNNLHVLLDDGSDFSICGLSTTEICWLPYIVPKDTTVFSKYAHLTVKIYELS